MKQTVKSALSKLQPNGGVDRVGSVFKSGFKKGRADGPRVLGESKSAVAWNEMTIHRAKGLEFDGVIVFWPKPGGRSKVPCPSREWWADHIEGDEREIAYVAATRAKKLLVFCFHTETVEALRTRNPEFLQLMEVLE